MCYLEVLQSFPLQRKDLLSSLGSIETFNPGAIVFDSTNLKPYLPYHVVFQIVVSYTMKYFTWIISCIVVDEGSSNFVMSLACWKAIGHLGLSPSLTFLMTFDNRSFRSHGIIPYFLMQLGGKTMCVEVEVVDVPLDYNLLLERSWTYAMHVVVATIFWLLCFSHEGRIVTIDQVSFSHPHPSPGASTVPMIDSSQIDTVKLGDGLFPSFMGTFDYLPPFGDVNIISIVPN